MFTQELALNRFQQLMEAKEEEIAKLSQDVDTARAAEREALRELELTKKHLAKSGSSGGTSKLKSHVSCANGGERDLVTTLCVSKFC